MGLQVSRHLPAGLSRSHHLLPPTWPSLPRGQAEPLLAGVHLQLLQGAGVCASFPRFQLSLPPLNRGASSPTSASDTALPISLGASPISGALGAAGRRSAQDARGSPSWDGAALLSFCLCTTTTTKQHDGRGSNIMGTPVGTPGTCFFVLARHHKPPK